MSQYQDKVTRSEKSEILFQLANCQGETMTAFHGWDPMLSVWFFDLYEGDSPDFDFPPAFSVYAGSSFYMGLKIHRATLVDYLKAAGLNHEATCVAMDLPY